MKHWWQALDGRERKLVSGGAVLVLAMLLYALAWAPFQRNLEGLRQSVSEQREELTWMVAAAADLQRLRQHGGIGNSAAPRTAGLSLPTLIDGSATAAGLAEHLKRVDPHSGGQLSVTLEAVEFDALIRWLGLLQRDNGVIVVNALVENNSASGLVDARLVLHEAAS